MGDEGGRSGLDAADLLLSFTDGSSQGDGITVTVRRAPVPRVRAAGTRVGACVACRACRAHSWCVFSALPPPGVRSRCRLDWNACLSRGRRLLTAVPASVASH